MITYIVGVPGSGKSYFAVYKLWYMFIRKEPEKKSLLSKILKPKPIENNYLYAYTNIDGFKFELDERLLKFDFEQFYSDMQILYAMYLDKKTDAEIIEVAKTMKLYKVMFIVDECHNYLRDKENPVLVWWVTYHRHLSHDLYLITQDLTLVNNEYKRIAEKFYKAIDSSKRLFSKTFKYAYFSSYKMNQCDRVNSFNINIPFIPEVFNLYHSGANSQSKSFVKFFISISILLVIVTIILFYYSYSSMFETSDKSSQLIQESSNLTISSETTTKPKPKQPDEPLQTLHYYNLTCIDEICRFKDEKYTFPYAYISYTLISSRPKYFYSNTKNKHFIEYFLVFDKPVLDEIKNLKKGVSNESVNQTSITSNLFK